MKKSKKILFLALSMSLAFSPINSMISNKANVAYAEEMMNKKEELSPEEFIQKAKDFVNSEEFKQYTKEGQDAYKKLIEDLKVENLETKKEEISKSIDIIKLSYIKKQYEDLKKEVLKLKAESLSEDLKKELDSYEETEETYDSYKDYEQQIEKLKTTKSNIENYNKDLKKFKDILKEGLEKNRNFGIDLKKEKLVLDDANSNLEKVEKAIETLNNKVKAYNAKTLKEEIIDKEENTKSQYYYKKSDESLKNNFNQSLDAIKKAYSKLQNKEEVNTIDDLVNSYYTAYNNLNGDKFMAEHQKLVDYFKKNKGKLSSSNQKKYADLINGLPDKADSNLDSIKKLKAEIEKAIEENPKKGTLRKVAVKKQPATKKSRSFVRTGVKSVGIVLVVLILAGIAYFFLSKKSKK